MRQSVNPICQGVIRDAVGEPIFHNASPFTVNILWGQPMKLIQVASTSELRENQWNNFLVFEIVPSHCCGASEAQT